MNLLGTILCKKLTQKCDIDIMINKLCESIFFSEFNNIYNILN